MADINPMEHPPGTGQAADPLDWAAWYEETLDALVVQVEAAAIEWGLDPDGQPYVIEGQQRPAGVEYPLAMVLEFRKVRDDAASDRDEELHDINVNVSVFDRNDPRDYASNLRKTIAQMGAVQSSLYDDRSLDGTCEYLYVEETTAFELETERTDETVGSIDLRLKKEAKHPY
ncbi:hypothetical protein [Halococcus saccharolyticus]|uniref:Uncharacterized protein n=1 Tax=Halococcus saccharolyticus DSM 5350 TaxID=1227455 RepID=M0MDC7_9EURY|nr:hypothetical protein [Halococcus saccharolyticus]EMA42659.1 hypothetical protein C449_15993 [Halococcus saccharolyticus DSM 5350]